MAPSFPYLSALKSSSKLRLLVLSFAVWIWKLGGLGRTNLGGLPRPGLVPLRQSEQWRRQRFAVLQLRSGNSWSAPGRQWQAMWDSARTSNAATSTNYPGRVDKPSKHGQEHIYEDRDRSTLAFNAFDAVAAASSLKRRNQDYQF